MPKTILVVDDKVSVRAMLRDYLTEQGYRILTAEDGQAALYAARRDKPDLVLLDLMMPEMDGYEFVRTYRKESSAPIILLTAKLEESDKVLGLELGADDYVTKPFGMKELLARVRAVLRRAGGDEPATNVLHSSDIVLDRGSHRVRVNNKEIELTPTEFDLLALLMSSPGQVFSRLDIMEKLQGIALEGAEKTINVHVRNLRMKIERDPGNPRYIETVFGLGYRFRGEGD